MQTEDVLKQLEQAGMLVKSLPEMGYISTGDKHEGVLLEFFIPNHTEIMMGPVVLPRIIILPGDSSIPINYLISGIAIPSGSINGTSKKSSVFQQASMLFHCFTSFSAPAFGVGPHVDN